MIAVDSKLFNGLLSSLKFAYGIVPIVVGADKFFNFTVNWEKYVSPAVLKLVPLSLEQFVILVGIIEIVAGLLVLSRWTQFGAYVVAAWLLAIVINLLLIGGYVDIAVRDLVIALGYVAYGLLVRLKETSRPA